MNRHFNAWGAAGLLCTSVFSLGGCVSTDNGACALVGANVDMSVVMEVPAALVVNGQRMEFCVREECQALVWSPLTQASGEKLWLWYEGAVPEYDFGIRHSTNSRLGNGNERVELTVSTLRGGAAGASDTLVVRALHDAKPSENVLRGTVAYETVMPTVTGPGVCKGPLYRGVFTPQS